MPFTSAELKNEIDNDPKQLGLVVARDRGDDAAIARILNTTYATVGTVWKTNLTARDLLACVVWADVSSFTAAQWAAFQTMLIPGDIDASQQRIRDQFAGIFAGKAATIANMTAAAKVPNPTRAEELWGAGSTISDRDVAAAYGRK